jgi:transcriptional regulator with XRE-family HTH domain
LRWHESITWQVMENSGATRSIRYMLASAQPVHDSLRIARATSGISQLELAMRLGVSQRHVSYVENGRTNPSRALLAAWLVELNLPLSTQNSITLKAGYAPSFSRASLTDPELAQAQRALAQLLQVHDPLPCYVIDDSWNLLLTNHGGRWLSLELMPWLAQHPAGAPLNMLDLFVHPDGVAGKVLNLDEVGPLLLAQLRREADGNPAINTRVQRIEACLRALLGSAFDARHRHVNAPLAMTPILTSRYATSVGELAFFSMFTTFGTPYDITLASIRVEHFFAANAATAKRLATVSFSEPATP